MRSLALRNKLVLANRRLVYHVTKRFSDRRDYEDINQVGMLELVRCVEKFDIKKGYHFSSYAAANIHGAVLHYLRDRVEPIRIPRQYLDLLSKAKKFSSLSDEEIAQELGVTLAKWHEAKRSKRSIKSLDAVLYDNSDYTLGDTLVGDYDPYTYALEVERSDQAHELLAELDVNERITMELIYLGEMTHKQVAEAMGKSKGSVGRYHRSALKQLRRL